MYKLIRPLLFRLDAERSHDIVLSALSACSRHRMSLRLLELAGGGPAPDIPCQIAGLSMPNPIGLAAGLDKTAGAFPALARFGFGSLELGTVTPRPQPGNAGKRMFRIEDDAALINRMGFNSPGLVAFLENLTRLRSNSDSILGINIGKNAETPIQRAAEDYLIALDSVYIFADYIAVNVSSPNTADLRSLQNYQNLDEFIHQLVQRRNELAVEFGKSVPLMLKIAPDLSPREIESIAIPVLRHRLDGVIATNTTVQRPATSHAVYSEKGGLSGRPLKTLSNSAIRHLSSCLQTRVPIIGVGGIENVADIIEKIRLGASMVQIYTSFVYQGPATVYSLLRGLEQRMDSMHISDWDTFREKLRS